MEDSNSVLDALLELEASSTIENVQLGFTNHDTARNDSTVNHDNRAVVDNDSQNDEFNKPDENTLDENINYSNMLHGDCEENEEETQPPLSDKEAESRFISWYEEICKERLTMLETEDNLKIKVKELEEAENGYRKRIKELEGTSVALIQAFEEVQTESHVLRKKYEPEDECDESGYKEPYNVVLKDRDRLIRAEVEHKTRIENLEEELESLKNYVNNKDILSIQHFHDQRKKVTKTTSVKRGERLVVITGEEFAAKMERENKILQNKLDIIEHENDLREISESEMIHCKCISDRALPSIKQKTISTTEKGKFCMRKNYSLPLLPKIVNSSAKTVEVQRSRSLTPLHSGLMFGLSYHEIHARKSLNKKTGQRFSCVSKYSM